MYKIFDIANWFLSKGTMTHKKIQKLCYYTQAWSIALYDKPIIDCKFEAWAHGAVCRELWEKLRDYTYYNIPQDTFKDDSVSITNKKDTEFMERVWETYKDFNGYQLEILTCQEAPWINARGNTPDSKRCESVISQEDMKIYYRSLYLENGSDN